MNLQPLLIVLYYVELLELSLAKVPRLQLDCLMHLPIPMSSCSLYLPTLLGMATIMNQVKEVRYYFYAITFTHDYCEFNTQVAFDVHHNCVST